jgi:AcrR family transcriptional regulator
MSDSEQPARRYHHGDLRRALLEAALRLLEKEGPTALSLRAVAREAGVSPAAPYHHFKDKAELLAAVGEQGWGMLDKEMDQAADKGGSAHDRMTKVGAAYVTFALRNPALYRVMFDAMREGEANPERLSGRDHRYNRLRNLLVAGGADPDDWVALELGAVAAWCASHGLAEMIAFKRFDPLREALGGEAAFMRAVIDQLTIYAHRPGAPSPTEP